MGHPCESVFIRGCPSDGHEKHEKHKGDWLEQRGWPQEAQETQVGTALRRRPVIALIPWRPSRLGEKLFFWKPQMDADGR